MCLDIKDEIIALKAKEDIVCYKHLIRDPVIGEYSTTYRRCRVILGDVVKSDIVRHKYSISEGLHSFGTPEGVIMDGHDESYSIPIGSEIAIFKCIIPKGSTYYEGTFCGHKAYASDKIKYPDEYVFSFDKTINYDVLEKQIHLMEDDVQS